MTMLELWLRSGERGMYPLFLHRRMSRKRGWTRAMSRNSISLLHLGLESQWLEPVTFFRCKCCHKAMNSRFQLMPSDEGILAPFLRRTREVGDSRKAQIIPVHSKFLFVSKNQLYWGWMGRTKAYEDEIGWPGDSTSSRVGVVGGEVYCASDNTTRVSHRRPDTKIEPSVIWRRVRQHCCCFTNIQEAARETS